MSSIGIARAAFAGIALPASCLLLAQTPRRAPLQQETAKQAVTRAATVRATGAAAATAFTGRFTIDGRQANQLRGATYVIRRVPANAAARVLRESDELKVLGTGVIDADGSWTISGMPPLAPGDRMIGCLQRRGQPEICSEAFRAGGEVSIPINGTAAKTKHDTAKAAINNVR